MCIRRLLTGLATLLLTVGVTVGASAAEVFLDPAETATPAVGETVTFTLHAANVENLIGWEIKVAYDSAILSYQSFVEGAFLKQGGATFAVPPIDSELMDDPDGLDRSVLVAATSLGNAVDGSGDLGVFTFEVVSQEVTQLKLIDPNFIDETLSTIPANLTGAVLTVEVLNEPPVAVAGSDKTTTVGQAVEFDGSASTDDVGIETYTWDFGDGREASSDLPTATHIYTEPGSYQVTLTVTDGGGLTATDTLVVTVTGGMPIYREHEPGSPMLSFRTTFAAPFDPTPENPARSYVVVWQGEHVVESGQWLEYQIAIFSGNPTYNGGVDIVTNDGTALRLLPEATDQNGIPASPASDLSAFARDNWYHRQIPLDGLADKTITEIALGAESAVNIEGLYRLYVDNIQITDMEVSLLDVYIDSPNVPLATPAPTSTLTADGGVQGAAESIAVAGIITVSVDPRGKMATQWGAIKQR